eukprot:42451_1
MAHAHRIHNNHGAIRVNGPIANNSAQHKRPSSKSIERLAQSITRSMYETVHKWEYVQKRYYQKNVETLFEDWKTENGVMIIRVLLNYRKKCPCLNTFKRYKPHYVVKGDDPLSQMACDKCTEFQYLYQALHVSMHHKDMTAVQQSANIMMDQQWCYLTIFLFKLLCDCSVI